MSRSNYDEPFYVDIGTSIAAVRCASNHDVVLQYDHSLHPWAVELAKDACDRMNKEAKISRPRRNCDVGTAEEQYKRFKKFCFDNMGDGMKEYRCSKCPVSGKSASCRLVWAQMPYEEGGDR